MAVQRRALVTGASGTLGAWLARVAPPDLEVVPLTHRSPAPWWAGAPLAVQADLRDAAAAAAAVDRARPDVVVHAAYARDAAAIVDATRHVARAAAACGARLVLLSTEAVFSGDGRVRTPDEAPDPVWDYGRWKVDAEREARRAAADAGAPAPAVVRPTLLVSLDPPGPIAARLLAAARDGTDPGWYAGERRQPARAEDVAAAVWAVARHDDPAGVWHLPGPETLTRMEIAARVAAALRDRGSAPPGLRAGHEEPPPPRAARPRDLRLDGSRARAEIDWAPRPVPGG